MIALIPSSRDGADAARNEKTDVEDLLLLFINMRIDRYRWFLTLLIDGDLKMPERVIRRTPSN